MHSYPHKPFDKPTKNMVLYARAFIRNVQFANYGNDCGVENFAISNYPKHHDHQQQIDVNTLTFTNVAEANKVIYNFLVNKVIYISASLARTKT